MLQEGQTHLSLQAKWVVQSWLTSWIRPIEPFPTLFLCPSPPPMHTGSKPHGTCSRTHTACSTCSRRSAMHSTCVAQSGWFRTCASRGTHPHWSRTVLPMVPIPVGPRCMSHVVPLGCCVKCGSWTGHSGHHIHHRSRTSKNGHCVQSSPGPAGMGTTCGMHPRSCTWCWSIVCHVGQL